MTNDLLWREKSMYNIHVHYHYHAMISDLPWREKSMYHVHHDHYHYHCRTSDLASRNKPHTMLMITFIMITIAIWQEIYPEKQSTYNVHDHFHHAHHCMTSDLPWKPKCVQHSWSLSSLSLSLYDKWLTMEDKKRSYNIHGQDHYHAMTSDLPGEIKACIMFTITFIMITIIVIVWQMTYPDTRFTRFSHRPRQTLKPHKAHQYTPPHTSGETHNGPTPVHITTPVHTTTHHIMSNTQHCTKWSHTSTQHHTLHQDKQTVLVGSFLVFLRTGQAK